jgi:hypothetical protein
MEALYGMLVAVPTVWACAGYVLVSHPGTAETSESRTGAKLMTRSGCHRQLHFDQLSAIEN